MERHNMNSHSTIEANINVNLPWTERIWKQLANSLESPDHNLNSALFFGKTGLGKTHLALRYAMKALNQDDVFLAANHPDLHVLLPENEAEKVSEILSSEKGNLANHKDLTPDELLAAYALRYIEKNSGKAKKIISVQQIRLLINQVVQHPNIAENKVVIIKNADKMNTNAANALLKTLEEPPKNTIFLLIADQIEKLPITIRSRCAEFHFRTPDKEIGLQWLEQQGLNTHTESYLMMASRAPLAALNLAGDNEIENLREIFSSINHLWARKKSSLELANDWKKYDFSIIFKHLNQFLYDLLKLKSLNTNNVKSSTELFYPVQSEWSKKIAASTQIEHLFTTIEEFQSIQKLGESPVDKQLLLENAAIQLEKLALSYA